MPKLSVTVITKNEETNLAAALESVAWADEIVVVDAESSDRTTDVARRFTEKVSVRQWNGYVEQKNFAAGIASYDWILSLDADERVSSPLADEIRQTLRAEPSCRGFRIPRVSWYLGRWIRSTDWYPDYQLRLYDRRAGRWRGRHVHESVSVDGAVGHLQADLQHFAYRDIAHHLETMNHYSSLAARESHEGGRRATALQILLHPPLAFLRNVLLRGGWRDGSVGLVVSGLNAWYVFLKYAKLRELDLRHGRTARGDTSSDPSAH